MSRKDNCTQCHIEVPVKPGGKLVKDSVNICRDCHFAGHEMTHPVDIRPGNIEKIPLPLDFEGSITCTTCHDPHTSPYATVPYVREGPLGIIRGMVSYEGFRTFFLRQPNNKGQICLYCHLLDDLVDGTSDIHDESVLDYRGSETCANCHEKEFDAWRLTLHARTLEDATRDHGAILATFTGEEPFSPGEIVETVGWHWTQRYLVDRTGQLKVARGVWMVPERKWGKFFWREQPWREQCAGCHHTGYNPYLETFIEKGVGCESCHGPGGAHADSEDPNDIVNPDKLSPQRRDSICASCHTHGHDRTGEFRYPVGFIPGRDLAKYFKGLIPKKGQNESFRGDGTLEDRLRSFMFWVNRFFSTTGVNCTLCKSFRAEGADGVNEEEPEDMTLAQHCLNCHMEISEGDEYHSAFRLEDRDCFKCHEPLRDDNGHASIHDHKFVFSRGIGDPDLI